MGKMVEAFGADGGNWKWNSLEVVGRIGVTESIGVIGGLGVISGIGGCGADMLVMEVMVAIEAGKEDVVEIEEILLRLYCTV